MSMILLDHILGEWNTAAKIDAIDFVEQAESDFMPHKISKASKRLV
ncbi:hypothetical protein QG071_00925 [Kingella kingae]|nr:hypothetical protein [Kingella kingae]MDK4528595.1 hypothetical protein [Kingella kingae]MDK4543148.1 hypothetical protein [Kingella kingae]MDK4554618.1 hypothetical protein [Kingella kingae]MDK4562674.1 hypothetical protein [Kingella kingae]MDK4564215.1 hypothetical protein [Kingella kingae]